MKMKLTYEIEVEYPKRWSELTMQERAQWENFKLFTIEDSLAEEGFTAQLVSQEVPAEAL